MILKNKQIIQIFESIYKIKQSNNKIPIKISFILTKNYKMLEELYKLIIEHRKNIYLEYGVEQDNNIIIKTDKIQDYIKTIEDFLNIDNEVNISKLKLSDFDDSFKITLEEMEGLYEIIDED